LHPLDDEDDEDILDDDDDDEDDEEEQPAVKNVIKDEKEDSEISLEDSLSLLGS
jgi:hypothetical protein